MTRPRPVFVRAAAIACLVNIAGSGLEAQRGSRLWRPEERVVLRDFGYVARVAVAETAVYGVTPNGIIVYDHRFRRWSPPVTPLSGFPDDGAAILSAIVDPVDDALWIGTATGLIHYEPVLGLVRTMPVVGGAQRLGFDRDDAFRGLYVQTQRGWLLVLRGSTLASPVAGPGSRRMVWSPMLEDVLRRYPAADAMQGLAISRATNRAHRIVGGASLPPAWGSGAFFGTDGAGVLFFDAGIARLEPLPFGLVADGVGAVLVGDGGVWAGSAPGRTAGARAPAGFSHVSRDVQRSRFDEGGGAGYRFRTTRVLVQWRDEVWAGTDRGVYRVGSGRGPAYDGNIGLPDSDVAALAVNSQGLWVGTRRGVALIPAHGGSPTGVDIGAPVLAMATVADTVWMGTDRGLFLIPSGALDARPAPDALMLPELRLPVVALATRARWLVVGFEDGIAVREPEGGWIVEPRLGDVDRIAGIAPDAGGAWIGSRRGVVHYTYDTRARRRVVAPIDLPGIIHDLAVDTDFLWIATEGGLVRVEK